MKRRTIAGVDSRKLLVAIGIVLCTSNILLVSVLAATGALRTARPGDISTTQVTHTDTRTITLPDSQYFIIENPTDVDVFYNIVVLVSNGGPLYTSVGHDPFVQLLFNYFPLVYYVFVPSAILGYVGFKVAWLLLSLLATVGGTALLLRAEALHRGMSLSRPTLWGISLATIGFHPMVANFKVGQVTPIMYFFVALSWFLFRQYRLSTSGAALVGAALFKPYVAAPLVVFARPYRWKGLAGFGVAYLVANVLSVLTWGIETTVAYYQRVLQFLLSETAFVVYDSFSAWSASHLRMFYWLGGWSIAAKIVLLVPVALLAFRNLLQYDDDPVPLFSLSLVAIIIGLKTTTAIDLALLLAAIVVLGFRFVEDVDGVWPLATLVVAFGTLQAHGYVVELLAGWGAQNISLVANNEALIMTWMPVLQPGTYGVFLLYGLGLYAWRTSYDGRGLALLRRYRSTG